ncbi:nitroreductase family protein [Bacillus taeanensis]|uniref:Nitroreductase n=1 Tax=Bacillus taeanensis TaxID=273032 RepID=A0A366XVL1_9BACI|nr:nitroreductase family protein [Bacillus taeanensis]RBW68174.1 nitroreductase [Bacillus taeanensis]
MNVLDAIQKRREITRFSEKEIPKETLESVVEAAFLAPSGNHLPSREFIVVTKRDMLDHLADATPFVPWLKEAAAAIVVTGRPTVSKYWLQDASIAAGYVWLTAVDLELGAAFGAIYHAEDQSESEKRESFVRKALNISDDRKVVAILGLGYPEKQPDKKKQFPREEIIHYEKFS